MEEKKQKGKKSCLLITALIVILLIASALGGYLMGATKITNEVVENGGKEKKEVVAEEFSDSEATTEETDTTKENSSYRICTGEYKGYGKTVTDAKTGKETKAEFIVNLTDTGEYDFSSGYKDSDYVGNKESGTFVVKDNTLILMHLKHTYGPEDQNPSYVAETHVIAKDCSKIKLSYNDGTDGKYDLIKQ